MMSGTRSAILPAAAGMALLFVLMGLEAAAAAAVGGTQLRTVDARGGVMMGRALATASDNPCPTELAACSADDSCVTCAAVFNSAVEGCGLLDAGSCGEAQGRYCCALEDEDEDCENDTRFSDYIECLWQSLVDGGNGCEDSDVDLSDCSGATGRSSPWGTSAVLSSTALAGFLIAAVGFAV